MPYHYYVIGAAVLFIVLFIVINLVRQGPCTVCYGKGYFWKDTDDGRRVKETCSCKISKKGSEA